MAELFARGVRQHGHAFAVAGAQCCIRIDVNLFEADAKRSQQVCHLLAQMAAGAPVEPSLYR